MPVPLTPKHLRSLPFKLGRSPAGGVVLVLVVLAQAFAIAPASGAPGRRSASCTTKGDVIPGIAGSHVLSIHPDVILYRVRGKLSDTVWACARGRGRGAAMGRDETFQAERDPADEYGPELTLGPSQVVGDWAMLTQEKGAAQEAACIKYMSPCPGRVDTLVVADAATGLIARPAQVTTAALNAEGKLEQTLTLTRTLLSAAGVAVWLERSTSGATTSTTLFGCFATTIGRTMTCSAQQLAEGQIDPGSLQLARTVVSWTQAGQNLSATIR